MPVDGIPVRTNQAGLDMAGICFAWWNTSLSPPSRPNRASAQDREIAAAIVYQLAEHLPVDCLGLGEVTTQDLDFLCAPLGSRFARYDGTLKAGRAQFDTALVYNWDRMDIISTEDHFDNYAGRRLKIANRVTFLADGCEGPIHLFVSHWPSRIWCPQSAAKRHTFGVRLRHLVEQLQSCPDRAPYVILLGDYNDEPFDESLDGMLLATRDRGLVRKPGVHLYNPFWRHLGEPDPYIPGQRRTTFCGTCYDRRGELTSWRTFDQIIFSSAFLSPGSWQLNEQFTRILQFESLTTRVGSKGSHFDHFPVLSVIERTEGGEANG